MKIFAALLVVLAAQTYAQKIPVKSKPSWVKEYSYSEEVKDTLNASGGYYDLVSNTQYNTPLKEYFHHSAQKVLSAKGLENVSTISQSFDPLYEQLSFHWIKVIRNGKAIDQLALSEFRVLKREQNLERLMYDGEMTAVFNLYDVQVGDVVDYAYSIRGGNPNFGNKSTRLMYLNYSVPVGQLVRRIVTDAKHNYQLKKFNAAPDPQISLENGQKIYEWMLRDVPPLLAEESTPGWFDAYDHIQISDFGSWADLSVWAANLFQQSATSKHLLPGIPGIDKENKEEAIRRLIQFVQDDIRYLSFSEGIHGYKPHPPDKILEQRFGDCKDKSFLLATLLTELGMESHPVLVNTSYGKALPDYLPSPTLFDHCIVQYKYLDSMHWVDPTYSLQRGPISKIYMPRYYNGLPVSRDSKLLDAIPFSTGGKIAAVETFYLEKAGGGGGKLSVQTTYTGSEADDIRSYLRSNSRPEIEKQYLNFYANEYPDVKSDGQVKWTDDEVKNVIVTEEKYKIPEFWKYDSEKDEYKGSTYARSISNCLMKPKTKLRETPFHISFPTHVTQEVILHVPEPWDVTDQHETIESGGFTFTSKYSYQDRIVNLFYSYQSIKPFVEASEIRNYIAKVEEVSNSLGFEVSYKESTSEAPSWKSKILVVLISLTIFLSYRWFVRAR